MDVDNVVRGWLAQHGNSGLYGTWVIVQVARTKVLFPLIQKLLQGAIQCVTRGACKDSCIAEFYLQ